MNMAMPVPAVVASVGLVTLFAGAIGRFVSNHPSIKMLASPFLVAAGAVLIAEGFGHHAPMGYLYFAMAFSLGVEMLNTACAAAPRPCACTRPARRHGRN